MNNDPEFLFCLKYDDNIQINNWVIYFWHSIKSFAKGKTCVYTLNYNNKILLFSFVFVIYLPSQSSDRSLWSMLSAIDELLARYAFEVFKDTWISYDYFLQKKSLFNLVPLNFFSNFSEFFKKKVYSLTW